MNPVYPLPARKYVIILFLLSSFPSLHCQDSVNLPEQENEWISDFYEENEQCFRCHETGITPSEGFPEDTIDYLRRHGMLIDREAFYKSNHRSFACDQCHFDDETDIRILAREGEFTCLNCHGFDPANDQYPFAQIAEEYGSSVHATNRSIGFSCWKCHNPHSYRSVNDTNLDLTEAVVYHNAICLDCHSKRIRDSSNSRNGGNKEFQNHDWLPNQTIHLSMVKCIECHTPVDNGIALTHLVLPGEQSEMRCVECHSQEPRLLAILNNFHAKGQRSKKGFYNSALSGELSILGTAGTDNLNTISIVIFLLTLFGIVIHIYFRIRVKRMK